MSTPPTWLKVAVRTVRRSPRLSAAADSALAHARGNRAMVDIANRVFGLDFTQPIVFLNAGRALAEVSAVERLPIVLVRVATMFFRYRAWLIVDVERGPQGAAVIDLAGRRILEQLEHYLPGRADGASRST